MTLIEALRSALRNLALHKLRTGLTMLGMIFGVGAVIAMLSIGAGAESEALEMIDAMGLRNVMVHGKDHESEELREIRKKSLGLSRRDSRAIVEAVPGVESVASKLAVETYQVIAAGTKSKPTVYGVPHDYLTAGNLGLAEGRFFDRFEQETHAQVAIIGSQVRRDLFGYGSALGHDIKVNDVWLTVIGVLQPESLTSGEFQGVEIESSASHVLMPLPTALKKFDHDPLDDELDEIIVTLQEDADPSESASVIAALLDRLHGGADDYGLTVPQALLEQQRQTQRLFNIVMGCIAGISLLVGGIGIMNIMLATVLERTREIGIRRAVGARRSDVRNQFIIEAFAISVIGGAVGVTVGLAIARGVAAYADWTTIVTAGSILLSTGVSLAVGLVFGIYPALRAARLDPIDALGYE
jgi:putative ABC transport system permease protein